MTVSSMPMIVFFHCRSEDGWPWVGDYCSIAAAVLGHTSNQCSRLGVLFSLVHSSLVEDEQ